MDKAPLRAEAPSPPEYHRVRWGGEGAEPQCVTPSPRTHTVFFEYKKSVGAERGETQENAKEKRGHK